MPTHTIHPAHIMMRILLVDDHAIMPTLFRVTTR
ncbi:MAG: hypothetical protein ACI8PG_002196, partial [Planctomycetota bacterium]